MRIEDSKGSSEAVKLAGKHVIPKLLERGYIKGFEQKPVKTVVEANQKIKRDSLRKIEIRN